MPINEEKKVKALMTVIEKMIDRHKDTNKYCLDVRMFGLFATAKKIHQARTEDEFQLAIADL